MNNTSMTPTRAKKRWGNTPECNHSPLRQFMMARSSRDRACGFTLLIADQYLRKKLDVGMISQIINGTARPHQGNVKKVKKIRQGIKNPLSLQRENPKKELKLNPFTFSPF